MVVPKKNNIISIDFIAVESHDGDTEKWILKMQDELADYIHSKGEIGEIILIPEYKLFWFKLKYAHIIDRIDYTDLSQQ